MPRTLPPLIPNLDEGNSIVSIAVSGNDVAATDGTPVRTAIEARGLTKTFGRAKVLDDVDLDLVAGEVHSLIGQNGSGKSTIVKILSGIYTADRGSVLVDGIPLSSPASPDELRRHGVAFVHQDLGLVPDLTVLENIRIGHYRPSGVIRRISWRGERAAAQQTLEGLHASIDVDRRVGELHAGQRALVAIARALQSHAADGGCIVFDEATQSLPRESIAEFNEAVREIAQRGTAILMVTHRLEEVTLLADRVTVLRDGRVVAGGIPAGGLTEAALSHLVLGRELETTASEIRSRRSTVGTRKVALNASGLFGKTLRGLNLELRCGEVLGVTGPTDSGHEELPYVLAGDSQVATGTVIVNGNAFRVPRHGVRDLRAAGVALVPQHRLADGLAGDRSALENLTLPRVGKGGRGFLRRGWQMREFNEAVRWLGVDPARPHAPVAAYSGGNQQKLLLAKWMSDSPGVLIAHEPTQAVDVGARAEILRALRAAARDGMAILISSVEAQDLAFVCDRVLVLRNGVIAAELTSDITATDITEATYSQPGASSFDPLSRLDK